MFLYTYTLTYIRWNHTNLYTGVKKNEDFVFLQLVIFIKYTAKYLVCICLKMNYTDTWHTSGLLHSIRSVVKHLFDLIGKLNERCWKFTGYKKTTKTIAQDHCLPFLQVFENLM